MMLTLSTTLEDTILEHFQHFIEKEVEKGQVYHFQDSLETFIELTGYQIKLNIHDRLKSWFYRLKDFDFIQDNLIDPQTSEILIHSPMKIQTEKNGQLLFQNINLTNEELFLACQWLCLRHQKTWNYSSPFASFYIELKQHAFRVSLIHPCLTSGPFPRVSLRRIATVVPQPRWPASLQSILEKAIEMKQNILIAGATGSGKTTFMKQVLSRCPQDEHIIILEDTREILSPHVQHTQLLSGNGEKKSLAQYLTYSLRMRPDRILLGEVRSHEIVPLLMALNTGHNGLLTSIHANSSMDALDRLVLLFKLYSSGGEVETATLYQLFCRSLDLVVYLQNKEIIEVVKVVGVERHQPICQRLFTA